MKEQNGWIETVPENFKFIHSRCCMAHWELIWNIEEGVYELRCEKCGKFGLDFPPNHMEEDQNGKEK